MVIMDHQLAKTMAVLLMDKNHLEEATAVEEVGVTEHPLLLVDMEVADHEEDTEVSQVEDLTEVISKQS
jgi:hypothetical protein